MKRRRMGFTLVELVATLAVLGLVSVVAGLAGVAALAVHGANRVGEVERINAKIQAGRRDALVMRHIVVVPIQVDETVVLITALPDGRLLGAERFRTHTLNSR